MQIHSSSKRSLVSLAALVCGLFTLAPRAARADEPRAPSAAQTPESPELALMDAELDLYAARAKSGRVATIITTAVSAAALVPAGWVLAKRADDPLAHNIGIGMAIGGAAPLLFTLPFLAPSANERLQSEFQARRASGMPEADVVRLTEADWESAADAAHGRRIVIGIVDLTLGTLSTAAGMYFLLADPVGSMSRNDQYTLGSSLVGPGVPIMAFGLRSLLQESDTETSWKAYHATKVVTAPKASAMPAVGAAPLRGGAAAFATFTF